MSAFKDAVADDMDDVFLNEDEFAEEHNLIEQYPEKADALRELMGRSRTDNPLFQWKNK